MTPDFLGGIPIFTNTRVPVQTFIDYLRKQVLEVLDAMKDHAPLKGASMLIRIKKSLLIALIAMNGVPFQASANQKVQFRLNKIHGLVVFVEAVLDMPTQAVGRKDFQEFFENSPDLNTKRVKDILDRFKETDRFLAPWFTFPDFPANRVQGNWGSKLLMVQSAYSTSLEDLSTRMAGLIPLSKHELMISSLKELLPYYEKSLWNPSLDKLKKYKIKFESLSKKVNWSETIEKVAVFYRSEISSKNVFTVSLYPMPGKVDYIPGMGFGFVESVGVPIDNVRDLASFGFSTIFHELCHSLSESQSPKNQSQMDKWFTAKPSFEANPLPFSETVASS